MFCVFLMCGVIWNLDAGAPALGAFFVYLILLILFPCNQKRSSLVWSLIIGITASCITFAVFTLFIMWKSGTVSIPWGEWVRYQKIFYITGFNAILLPTHPHLWMVVIVIYLAGIIGFMRRALDGTIDRFWSVILYISIMGLGLFPYYQHRAHDMVLLAAGWPALLIGLALSDRLHWFISNNRLSRLLLVVVLLPEFILGILVCGFFIYQMPTMIKRSIDNWTFVFSDANTPIKNDLRFMRSWITASNNESVVILAPHQALYFAELGIPSAIKGAGIGETFLPEDKVDMANRILDSRAENLFIKSVNGNIPLLYFDIIQKYNLIDGNNNGILYFKLK